MTKQSLLQPAYLLHRRSYSDSSLLVECFTPAGGRFPALAKGVKGKRGSRSASILQPFTPLLVAWSGKGEVKTLVNFEPAAAPLVLQGNRLYCGFYLNELLMRLLGRNDPHESLFARYAHTLETLSQGFSMEVSLRHFEVDMLEQLGYGLVLDREIETGAQLNPNSEYNYVIDRGPVLAEPGITGAIRGSTLLAMLQRELLEPRALREARALTRLVLARYLGERPLKSRELFREVR